ncbi:MAG: hypothetical protein KatS3mg003_1119 [Candidatus Nitrosocaldaceae archaeon]|nr:MAG: hypothetical protein KatS3mg003_1119 [Candidatus Nitrosocaldaceae archaeon]
MSIIRRIDEEIEKYSLLKHPFYQMWTEGKLTLEHLQGYAKEYMHLVNKVPEMVSNVARYYNDEEILENLEEEKQHIALWRRFAKGIGVNAEELDRYDISNKVRDAVDTMLRLSNSKYGIASMYAYEAQLPEISKTKLEGLMKLYNIRDDDTLEYQRVHAIVDIKHSQTWRRLIDKSNDEELINVAVESLKAQNRVLDGVYEQYIA